MTQNLKNHITFTSCHEMKEICQPLFRHFPIKAMDYSKIFLDGSRAVLCTHPETTEIAFINQKNLIDVYTPDFDDDKYVFAPHWINRCAKDPKAKKVVEKVSNQLNLQRELLNIGTEFWINKKTSNYFECFEFQSDIADNCTADTYFRHIELFDKFILYFRAVAHKLIIAANEQRLILPWRKEAEIMKSLHVPNKEAFLKEIKIKKFPLQGPFTGKTLTGRELDCAIELLKGKTIKEIAKKLKLSPRTAEHHVEHIKTKLSCKKKSELIELLSLAGLLDMI